MKQKLKTVCVVITAILTAPVWVPFYIFHCAKLWREDCHD